MDRRGVPRHEETVVTGAPVFRKSAETQITTRGF